MLISIHSWNSPAVPAAAETVECFLWLGQYAFPLLTLSAFLSYNCLWHNLVGFRSKPTEHTPFRRLYSVRNVKGKNCTDLYGTNCFQLQQKSNRFFSSLKNTLWIFSIEIQNKIDLVWNEVMTSIFSFWKENWTI